MAVPCSCHTVPLDRVSHLASQAVCIGLLAETSKGKFYLCCDDAPVLMHTVPTTLCWLVTTLMSAAHACVVRSKCRGAAPACGPGPLRAGDLLPELRPQRACRPECGSRGAGCQAPTPVHAAGCSSATGTQHLGRTGHADHHRDLHARHSCCSRKEQLSEAPEGDHITLLHLLG